MPIAPEKPAAFSQERGANAKCTQADLRKSLLSSSSQEPSAPGKPAALFSLRSEEPENQFKSSVFKNADPSNVRKSLLDGNSNYEAGTSKVESLNSCIDELQQQAYAQRLEMEDAHHG